MTNSAPSTWMEAVIINRRPLEPLPTEVSPRLSKLKAVHAVVFDVYGTLIISGSGDVGTIAEGETRDLVAESMKAAGYDTAALPKTPTADDLRQQIADQNDRRRCPECPAPEVDILQAWRSVLRKTELNSIATEQVVRLASDYESRINPTWPMPGAARLLASISTAGMPMGIVSNAQVFTLPLVRELVIAAQLPGFGFDLDLCVCSNRFRHAKPGPRLFQILCAGLQRRGIAPQQALYVGNDMLNDIWAASQAGLRTAWFAGDARSCRSRPDDSRCRGLEPDLVLTELTQLSDCLGLG